MASDHTPMEDFLVFSNQILWAHDNTDVALGVTYPKNEIFNIFIIDSSL